ncbi:MAG TPA: DUF1697 domain-containing protein [Bacteroidetes bacterium]|nr:DUF1697 domain-containing protein [Bacteroidota bacterium]
MSGKILEKYGFEVPVMVKDVEEVRHIAEYNPFLDGREIDATKLHVTFLNSVPVADDVSILNVDGWLPDAFVVRENAVYLYCPNGYGRTKLTNGFWERKLKVVATTRNWKTVNKLLALAGEMG